MDNNGLTIDLLKETCEDIRYNFDIDYLKSVDFYHSHQIGGSGYVKISFIKDGHYHYLVEDVDYDIFDMVDFLFELEIQEYFEDYLDGLKFKNYFVFKLSYNFLMNYIIDKGFVCNNEMKFLLPMLRKYKIKNLLNI